MTGRKLEELSFYYKHALIKRYPTATPAELAPSLKAAKVGLLLLDTRINHLLWVLEQIPELVDSGKIEKAMRWLGFIQGVLFMAGVYSIDELRDHSKPDDSVTLAWSRADDIAAKKQGWALFDSDGINMIQKLDDPAGVQAEIEEETGMKIKIVELCCDDTAIDYVRLRAEASSDLHQRAIKLHNTPCRRGASW